MSAAIDGAQCALDYLGTRFKTEGVSNVGRDLQVRRSEPCGTFAGVS